MSSPWSSTRVPATCSKHIPHLTYLTIVFTSRTSGSNGLFPFFCRSSTCSRFGSTWVHLSWLESFSAWSLNSEHLPTHDLDLIYLQPQFFSLLKLLTRALTQLHSSWMLFFVRSTRYVHFSIGSLDCFSENTGSAHHETLHFTSKIDKIDKWPYVRHDFWWYETYFFFTDY